jgi:hypothetical protein
MEDAELLAPAFSKHPGQLSSADLCNLPNFTAYVRLLDPNGNPTVPFSLRTLPPRSPAEADNREDITLFLPPIPKKKSFSPAKSSQKTSGIEELRDEDESPASQFNPPEESI